VNVREAIYSRMVATGTAPTAGEAAALAGITFDAAEQAYRDLAEAHVIVLDGDSGRVLFAPPFSNVPTGFRVHTPARAYFGVCAWDAFGVAASLHTDARIEAACAWSGDPIVGGVERGRAYGGGVIHLLVPAAHFWDDIVFT
jgi:hypothetical protein